MHCVSNTNMSRLSLKSLLCILGAYSPLTVLGLVPGSNIPPGWIGGFEASNPAFAYPNPDLSSLPMLDNMANIDLLQRMQKVIWPEFSWESIPGVASSRVFSRFAPDISRVGYTNEGRIYSIICPQLAVPSRHLGNLNIEVTVTGNRGWVDEPSRGYAADVSTQGTVWFSAGTYKGTKAEPVAGRHWPFFVAKT